MRRPHSPNFANERGWRNWATSFVVHLFSTLVTKFQFHPLLPSRRDMSTCPLHGAEGMVGWGGITASLLFSAASCLVPIPAAHCHQRCLVMGQKWNTIFCLQVTYLFHSPATLHLFRCCRDMHREERFLALSASQEIFGLWGFFITIWEICCSTSYFIFFTANLCECITSSQFAMDCRCCRGELIDSVSNCAKWNYWVVLLLK